ncbi:MAG: hypothetical protein ABSH03_00435 [Candidatus Lustribacter sp.]|jgi:hypothetical protein
MSSTIVDVLTSLDLRRPSQPPPTFPNGFDDQILAVTPDLLTLVHEEFARLAEFRRLPLDWDHEGGVAMTADASASAQRVLRAFAAIAGFVPQVVPSHAGGALIEVCTDNLGVDFEISPLGDIEFLVSRGHEDLEGTIRAAQVPALLQTLYVNKRNETLGLSA